VVSLQLGGLFFQKWTVPLSQELELNCDRYTVNTSVSQIALKINCNTSCLDIEDYIFWY
jgi:hypothetical protein